jgi:O-antigen/teichoic acid export membrane protein
MRALGAAAPAMALAFSGLAGPLLRVLYGVEFAGAAPILILLAWSAAANWLYAPLGVALQARGHERWWLASLAGGLALNAAANLWAIPRLGAFGAAAATLASEVALLSFGAVLVRRKLGILPSLRAVLVGLGATAAGGAVLGVLGAVGAVPATLAALLVYGGLLSLFRVVTAEDAVRVIGWVRQAASGPSHG